MTGLNLKEVQKTKARKYSLPLLIKDSQYEELIEAAKKNGLRLIKEEDFTPQGDCDKSDGTRIIYDLLRSSSD